MAKEVSACGAGGRYRLEGTGTRRLCRVRGAEVGDGENGRGVRSGKCAGAKGIGPTSGLRREKGYG